MRLRLSEGWMIYGCGDGWPEVYKSYPHAQAAAAVPCSLSSCVPVSASIHHSVAVINHSFALFVCLSRELVFFVCLLRFFNNLSICLPVRDSTYCSLCMRLINLSNSPFIHILPIYISVLSCFFACLSVCLSVCLPVNTSLSFSGTKARPCQGALFLPFTCFPPDKTLSFPSPPPLPLPSSCFRPFSRV